MFGPRLPYRYDHYTWLETHHMEFPGTIDIKPRHLEDFGVDVTTSVARHRFRRILLADGHGSNMPILNIAARRTVLESDSLCAAFIWPSIISDAAAQIRQSPRGGMAHACEPETSLYLHLNGEAVQMDKAVPDYSEHKSDFHWQDLQHGSKIVFMDWWSRISKTGTVGDPSLATADKGKIVFEAAVTELIRLVREFRAWTGMPRKDMH